VRLQNGIIFNAPWVFDCNCDICRLKPMPDVL